MPQLYVDQIITGSVLGLDWGLSDILYAEIGGRRIFYVLSRTDQKLVELEMASNGTLSVAGELALGGPFEVGSTPSLQLHDGAIVMAGLSTSAGQFVSLASDGAVGDQFSEAGVGEISSPTSVGSVLVSGDPSGDGLVAYQEVGSGLAWAASLSDDTSTYLANVADTEAISIGGENYVAAVSESQNGLTLVQVDTGGTLSTAHSFGTLDGLPISLPTGIESIQRLNETILVVASSGSSSLSTLSVDANAEIWLSDHILDSSETRFQAVSTVDTITVGEFAYVAAGGADGGVSLFTVLPGGRLVHLSTHEDTSATTLYRMSAVSMTYANGALQILGGSAWEAGLTRLSFDLTAQGALLIASSGVLAGTGLDDQIIGSDTGDALNAGEGDDILYDGHGADTLTGGGGADLFVFALDGMEDIVLDFERGTDRLDLSGFDFLYDISQLSITPETDGATLNFGDETLRLYSEDGGALTAADFANADILNVDRPPLLTVSQTLVGGAGADILNGNTGDDTISGLDGDDILSGGGGNDQIFGGNGADTLDGGSSHDLIVGGDGSDLIVGGTGDDVIDGGSGGDVIYGDEIA